MVTTQTSELVGASAAGYCSRIRRVAADDGRPDERAEMIELFQVQSSRAPARTASGKEKRWSRRPSRSVGSWPQFARTQCAGYSRCTPSHCVYGDR